MSSTMAGVTNRVFSRTFLAGVLLMGSAITPVTRSPANSDVPGDIGGVASGIWGIATDPFKLGQGSQNILDSVERLQLMLDQLGAVEATTNRDLADRIAQVKQIIDEVVTAINQNVANLQQIISQAEQKIVALENQIYLDAESLLDRLQCVAQNIATVQIQDLIANAVADLKAADPGITLLGIRIISLQLKQIQITDPDKAYISVRDAYLKRMNSLRSTDPAFDIVSTYANIERLAEGASCAYRDPTEAALFLKEEFNYRRLAGAWAIVPFTMTANTP